MKILITLRTRLVLLVLTAIVPLFGFSVFKSFVNIDEDIRRASKDLEFTASQVASTQERVTDSARQMLVAVTKVPTVAQADTVACRDYFRALNNELVSYRNMGLVGTDGYVLCESVEKAARDFVGDRSYFKEALARGDFVVSGYLIGRVTGQPVVAFALPLKDRLGNIKSVAFASLHYSELFNALAEVQLPNHSHLVITDRNGVVLADNAGASVAVGKPIAHLKILELIKAGGQGVFEAKDSAGVERIYALASTRMASSSAFFVAVGLDRNDIIALAGRQLTLELMVLLLMTGLGCGMAWLMGGRSIVQPTLEILEATANIQNGALGVRIAIPHDAVGHELTRIARGVNNMADTIEQRERDLKRELARSQQARNTLDSTVNSMQDGLIAVDANGRILLINEAAKSYFLVAPGMTPLSREWPRHMGLLVPGTNDWYAFDDLPLYKALHGEDGGPQHVLVKNQAAPEGRLISARYRPIKDGDELVGALVLVTDITQLDRLQVEQTRSYAALRETQRKLLDAQRLCRIGHWEFDLCSQTLTWSDELHTIFGLALGSFDGRHETVLKLIHPDDVREYTRLRDFALKNNTELDIQFRIITPAGAMRWMHQVGKTHFSDEGAPIYRAGVVQEITERKSAELALARTAELLQRTGELAMVGGWEITLHDMRLVYSDQTYRIHDLIPGAPISVEDAKNAYGLEARLTFEAAVNAAVINGLPWDLELPLTTRSGRSIWVRTQGQAVRQGVRTVKLVGALQDITAQRESREQLRLLETCVSRLNDILLITEAEPLDSPGPRIVFVNDAFERRTGYSREEVLGQSPRLLQGPNTQRAELDRIGAALRQWQPVRAELINYTKSGEEFWIELDIVPIADPTGHYTHWVAIERDITQRKLAEKALTESEQRYTAMFETAPVPMWVIDLDTGRFVMVNSAAVQTYGYSKEELLSMTLFDIRPESEYERLGKDLADGVVGSERREVWLHRHKDGSVFPVNIFARSIQYGDKVMRFVVALDVSAQVKAEKEVQEHLFTLQRAADAAQAITWHQTLDGTLQEVAEQARGVIGANQAVVSLAIGGDSSSVITSVSVSPKYTPHIDQIKTPECNGVYALVAESNRSVRMTQAELEVHPRWRNLGVYADSHPTMRGWLAVPLMNRSGKNMGVLQLSDKYDGEFTLQDEYVAIELAQLASIAIQNAQLIEEVGQLNIGLERKVAERTVALARQEALFRGLAEQAPQVVWTSDAHGAVTYVNQAWFGLVGGELRDWAGTRWFAVVHPEDLPEIRANWKIAEANGTPFVGMRRLRAKDGTYHTMSYRASPVTDDQGTILFWVGIDADITEVKTIEAALRLSNQELEAFSYSVSHDLRSPLNTIDGFSRLLAKQLSSDENVKGQHYLSRIQAGVAQMGQLIEDLLSLSQVSRMQLSYEHIDLTALSQQIVDECRVRQPDRRVKIDIEDGLRAQGDVRLVRGLMENLLGNAWKFTSRKEQASICVGQNLDAAGLATFFVQDNGAGFDMAYADKLFVAFQRLHAASEFPGTGIGLATVSRVVGRHGGRLWAESAPEQGATFFFTLPGSLLTPH